MPIYARSDLYLERGEGCYVFDDQNHRYLDFVAGVAVAGLGHAHPRITQALAEQAQRLWITSNLYKSHRLEALAQRLVDLSFADTMFLQNSGAEAWELGIKVIRKYFSGIGQPERYRIITFNGCFHGRSLAGIAAAKTPKMAGGFGPMMEGFDQVGWNQIAEVRAAITPETAGIVMETIQGEGGMRVASAEFLRQLRTLCDETGLLLYFDEIQCGLGRTGKMFAYEWAGIEPDVMCIAKALGNGFPIGACLATAKAASGMNPGSHGSTYGANPLAVAVAHAVLDELQSPSLLAEIGRKGELLGRGLIELAARYPSVFKEARGLGLMRALKCVAPNSEIIAKVQQAGLLTVAGSDNILRLLPPLIVSDAQIHDAVAILDSVAAPEAEGKTAR